MASMSFEIAASAYDRYIGRYSREIAPRFVDFAGVDAGPVLDVGCGPGTLTEVLAARFGAASVAAIDPSEPFVAACRARVPSADVRVGSGESLPFSDGTFAGALSQLVLGFVRNADAMASEMARVVKPDGIVAACMFEANGFAMVRAFWDAALRFDPSAPDDAKLPFRRMPELVALLERAGLRDVEQGIIDVEARYTGFDDFWSPFAFGIGPAGAYFKKLPDDRRAQIREACFELLGSPEGSFVLPARVLAVRGRRAA